MLRSSNQTALIIVDMQNDFLPGGALPVPKGDEIIQPLRDASRWADLVICSRDWHPRDHSSFKQWPPHCIQHTAGARIHSKIRNLANFTVSKGMDLDTDQYSAFAGQTLRPERKLQDLLDENNIGTVVIGGLAFDICVRWTALDANFLAFNTIVPLDLSKALTKEGKSDTLRAFERTGIKAPDHWEPK